jgi:hypothetical protein
MAKLYEARELRGKTIKAVEIFGDEEGTTVQIMLKGGGSWYCETRATRPFLQSHGALLVGPNLKRKREFELKKV